jgi:hypothetical protein
MDNLMEKIYPHLLADMAANGIEDTTENRAVYLEGMYDEWKADKSLPPEAMPYLAAIHGELFNLKLKIKFPNFWK